MSNNFNREIEIKKQMELYKKEQNRYKEKIKRNSDFKLIYHTDPHH